MTDWRLCTLCNREFDLDAPDITVLQLGKGSGRTTVVDGDGRVHLLTTRYSTERRRAQKSAGDKNESVS